MTAKKTNPKKSVLRVIHKKYRFYFCENCKKPFHRRKTTKKGAGCRYCGAK